MTKLIAVAVAAMAFGLSGCALGEGPPPVDRAVPGAVAVVELFTSEGCSSCPPADRVLAAIVKDADANHQPVYALAWHVDYWDNLGWADPYSSAAASARQSKYIAALKLDEGYTPQMVVNGRTEFVGSDADHARTAINAALSATAPMRVTIQHVTQHNNSVAIDYTTQNAPPNAVLVVAAVESGLSSSVARGENGGRILTHENVVRTFAQIALKDHASGHADLTLPAGVKPEKVSLIAFVQDPTTMAILGATGDMLPASPVPPG